MRAAVFLLLAILLGFATGCGKSPPAPPSDPTPTPRIVSDKDRLQGVWTVESWENGDPKEKMTEEERAIVRVAFEGDKMRFAENPKQRQDKLAISLNEGADPKTITLTQLDADGQPRQVTIAGKNLPNRSEWIYKFDGEILVLAVTGPEGKRPTEFKAKPAVGRPPAFGPKGPIGGEGFVPAVDIVRLKKTNEPFPDEPKREPFRGTRIK
ncbi:MAG: TIGR03067 domain-containing protein [Planctomycetes bacterium]|nr:TIGR03067 domain-containing protein [Planctomycetota bacterium]